MEKINTICMMRDIVLALTQLEQQLMDKFNLTLNEVMVLCCVGEHPVNATAICENTALAPSHASKIIRSVEEKGLLHRSLGKTDKRYMNFTLSAKGLAVMEELRAHSLEVPEYLQPLLHE